jgi:hypothetical protein
MIEPVHVLIDRVLPSGPTGVRIAGRRFFPGADRGIAVLLTAAGWVIQRLPGQVLEDQRGELIRTLGQARNLVVEVQCSPVAAVRVRDGQRLLVEIPAMDRQDGASRASLSDAHPPAWKLLRHRPPSLAECGCDCRHCSSSVLAVSSAAWMPSIAKT